MEQVTHEEWKFAFRLYCETTYLCTAEREPCKYLLISEIPPMTTVSTEENSSAFTGRYLFSSFHHIFPF